MTQSTDIDAQLVSLAETIAAAQERMAAGHSVDVAGLPEQTDVVCRAIADLPHETGREYEVRILAIIGALDDLAAKIDGKNTSLNEMLAELGDPGAETPDNG